MLRKTFSIIMLAVLISCSADNQKNSSDENTTTNEEEILTELMELNQKEYLISVFNTSMGKIEIELFARDVPKTVKNFIGLSLKHYYDKVIFHRVIDNFMIQCGDPTGTGRGGESYWSGKFEDEFKMHLKHNEAGILSMANAGPNTNGSQFFITLVPTPWLDGKHSIFGKVVSGMDVIRAIGQVPTDNNDKPIQDVVINSIEIEKRTR